MEPSGNSVEDFVDAISHQKRRRDAVTPRPHAEGDRVRGPHVGKHRGLRGSRPGSPLTTGVGCLYVEDLESVDREILQEIVASSYGTLSEGTFTQRVRGRRTRILRLATPMGRHSRDSDSSS
jgi:hypothetical protein